jgi:hypothetical protein
MVLALAVGIAGCGSGAVTTNGRPGTSTSTSANGPSTAPAAGRPYSHAVQATLLRTCEAAAGGTPKAVAPCECVLSHLEARVSQRTLETTERAIVKGEATVPQWLRAAGLACRQR